MDKYWLHKVKINKKFLFLASCPQEVIFNLSSHSGAGLVFICLNWSETHPVFDSVVNVLKSLEVSFSRIVKNQYSLEIRSNSLDLWKDFCYSYLEVFDELFVMFMRLLLCLVWWLNRSGLKESVWRSWEKEKFENLVDIWMGQLERLLS